MSENEEAAKEAETVEIGENGSNAVERSEQVRESKIIRNIDNAHDAAESDEILMVVLNDDGEDDSPVLTERGSENVKLNNSAKIAVAGNGSIVKLKKNVTFKGSDLAIEKFIGGEEIIDKENPFKSANGDTSVNYRFIKKNKIGKKSSIPAALPRVKDAASDFVTKEEVLRQSKYVPVYVKNPDRVLTYDKSIIGRLSGVESEVEEPPTPQRPTAPRRIPVPAPRKFTPPVPKPEEKRKKTAAVTRVARNSKYPDMSQIRVKTGTDIEETLYDPNEVAINVIKFDSLLRKKNVRAEEDSDERSQSSGETKEASPEEGGKEASPEGGKNLTNTVTSSEFKDFLRKKGLILVPARKPAAIQKQPIIDNRQRTPEKKNNILRRIFSGFSTRRTPPKMSSIPQKVYPSEVISNRQPSRKQQTYKPQYFSSHPMPHEDDQDSSISSLLTAADEDSPVSSPVRVRRKIAAPVSFTKKSPSAGRHIMRPTAQKVHSPSYLNNYQYQSAALAASSLRSKRAPPNLAPLRITPTIERHRPPNGVNDLSNSRSADKVANKVNLETQLSQLISPVPNGDVVRPPKKTSTPKSEQKDRSFGNGISPIQPERTYYFSKNSSDHPAERVDQYAFLRRREDLLRRSESCQPKINNVAKSPGAGGRNYDVIRGSPQRVSVSGSIPSVRAAPFRSQSALDGVISTPTRTLDKKQIMNELYAFYRRSVNNTPVPENEIYSVPNPDVMLRNSKKQPITNPHFKTPLPPPAESRKYVVFDSNQITPMDVIRHRSLGIIPNREPTYRNVQQRPASVTPYQPHYQLYNVSDKVRYDGRSTPLILSSQSPVKLFRHPGYPEPVYGRVQKQLYLNGVSARDPRLVRRQPLPLPIPYESDTASEAGEVQKIFRSRRNREEDWQNEKSSGRNQQSEQGADDRRRARSREDPRRHTLGGDMMQYANNTQTLPHQRSMDLEMGINSQKSRKMMSQQQQIRGYAPSHQGPLFDDDPGIMSEVETASTGFRRGGKQRSSLPVVRTPSKTLERPLGLVFLQYRNETKRALLPNEITSIDTVRALFVRSFPRQLSMAYLEGPNVKIYIHDSSKDMFYELEDVSLRSHLREIKDRSVLRLFESTEVSAPAMLPGGPNVPQPLPQAGGHWDQDPSYFSEPEFDSEYQHQHIHKSKNGKGPPYYVTAAQTLPRGMYSDRNKTALGVAGKPLRSYGSRGSLGPQYPYTPDQLYSIPDGYMSSPERGTRAYEEPYYSQYGTRGNNVTPIIDEEQNEQSLSDDQYALYGVKGSSGRIPRNQLYDAARPEDLHRIRVEHMERQLANLTGLVQKALTQNPQVTPNYSASTLPHQYRSDKSVSFEKSVSFSDDIQGGAPKSHNPVDSKPPKPAIKSSTLPRTSSQERTLKPAPPPKPLGMAAINQYRSDIMLAPEVYNHLRGLQKRAKDLRVEVRALRRLAQSQAIAVREDIKDSFMRIRATLMASGGSWWGQVDQEKKRLSKEEEIYKQEVVRLEKDLSDLESSVEGLRTEVINRRTRVNMSCVEDMALILSRASKTVAELKMKFPQLQQELRSVLATEMEQVCREEKFLKDEPDRLESALRRCKKLTGTLVTLKRLASVQEQRLPADMPNAEEAAPPTPSNKPTPSPRMGTALIVGGIAPENALDALLDELQTFAKPPNSCEPRDDSTSDDSSQTLQNSLTMKVTQTTIYPQDTGSSTNIGLRRLHSYPSGSDTDTSPPQPQRNAAKPPVPERNAELLAKVNKRVPPPPPPRVSSRSPLASPTSPNLPARAEHDNDRANDSSGESHSSQENSQRQMALEIRHQELLKKQKQLQEQYLRLQQMSKNAIPLAPNDSSSLKKTGSESNLPQKMGLNMSISGSMKNLSSSLMTAAAPSDDDPPNGNVNGGRGGTGVTTKQVYETDIL